MKHAGLKDKHAKTTQHVTARFSEMQRAGAPEYLQGGHWSARRVAWVSEAIPSKAIAVNRFRLVLRSLTRRDMREMDDKASRLDVTSGTAGITAADVTAGTTDAGDAADAATSGKDRTLRVVNYYGNQRFGSARHKQGFIASYLIVEQFEHALRLCLATPHRKDSRDVKRLKRTVAAAWNVLSDPRSSTRATRHALSREELPRVPERVAVEYLSRFPGDLLGAFSRLPYLFQQLCVDAYQSLLWNRVAADLVRQQCGPEELQMVVVDKHCKLVFPDASAVSSELADLDLPVLGHRSSLHAPWDTAAQDVLAAEGISTDQLVIPGLRRPAFREVLRPLFVAARSFHMGNPQPDELIEGARRFKRTVSFALRRGAYATVVLRALGQ